jgi:hypothetical protein
VWTPGGDNFCNNNGFASTVCNEGGWGAPKTVWAYECGYAAANVTSDYISSGKSCASTRNICTCMPGFSGERCEVGAKPAGAPIKGWCTPPWLVNVTNATWPFKVPVTNTARSTSYCSSRGWCEGRINSVTRDLRFSFCKCDEGYFGAQCELSDFDRPVEPYRYGSYFNIPIMPEYRDGCGLGSSPRIRRRFIGAEVTAQCLDHGFPLRFPVNGDFSLTSSNAYRAQTPAYCVCEPGYNGEECLGGMPVPDIEGWFSAVVTLILLLGTAFLYRQRKVIEQDFDDAHVTPGDFSVFVDGLPTLHVDDIPELTKHFEQWGKVHYIAPGTNDAIMMFAQKDKNAIQETLHFYIENEQHAANMGRWHNDNKKGPMPGLCSVPRTSGPEDDLLEDKPVTPWMNFLFQLSWNSGVGPLILTNAALLRRYIKFLNGIIATEIVKPEVLTFKRCFVTFCLSEAEDDVLDDHNEVREGIFGKTPVHPEKCKFRGEVLTVKQAAEPDEILWESLDTSNRDRWVRQTISTFVMFGVMIGMFSLVLVLNALPPDQNLAVNIALTIINILVATFWIEVARTENHYTFGSKMRSVYIKTLLTQLTITLVAGTLESYGYPLDSKNGYITDWYVTAGGFLFRQVIIESILPPIINFINMPFRAFSAYANLFGVSQLYVDVMNRPSPYILAERCAALMRTVILVSAFNPGLPILNFMCAFLVTVRYVTDKYCMQTNFKIQKAGPEMSRIMELTLMIAVLINGIMGWVTLRAGWGTSIISEIAFYIAVIFGGWAITGYFSFRWCHGRDCWCGSGPVVPCTAPLVCFNKTALYPFTVVHEFYMRKIYGPFFFGDVEDDLDETGGQTFDQLREEHNLRLYPYATYERAQMHPDR